MNYFLLVSLIAFFTYIRFWLNQKRNYWKNRGFEQSRLELPFGSFSGVGTKKSLGVAIDEYYKEYKGRAKCVGLYSFVKPLLLIIDPELVKNIFVQNFDSFHDRYLYYNREDDPISPNLLALKGREWRERRAKLTPTFTSGKMKFMFDIVNEIGDKFVISIENSLKSSVTPIEMHDFSARFTTDVISRVCFGLDSDSLNNKDAPMRKYGKEILELGFLNYIKFQFTCAFPDLSRKLHIPANKSCVTDFFYNTFLRNIEDREKSQIYQRDFLQMLIEMKKNSVLNVDELAAESFIFFLGGFETSSTLLSFTLYELALNPDIQERLRDEVKQALQENDGKCTYEMINSLEYMDRVISEALRMYPPALNIMRQCTKEFEIPDTNLVVPVGTDIWVNVISLQRDPEYWPEPEKFDPDRFLPENSQSRPQCAYLPFGHGPRRCIGGRFGLLQSKLGLVKLILNYEISPCEKTPIPMKFSVASLFLESADKMWLNLRKIHEI